MGILREAHFFETFFRAAGGRFRVFRGGGRVFDHGSLGNPLHGARKAIGKKPVSVPQSRCFRNVRISEL